MIAFGWLLVVLWAALQFVVGIATLPLGVFLWASAALTILGASMGQTREAQGIALLCALVLGPVSPLLMLAVDNRENCPQCAKPYARTASVCPYCRCHLSAVAIFVEPDDWMNQQVQISPAQAEWAARAGKK